MGRVKQSENSEIDFFWFPHKCVLYEFRVLENSGIDFVVSSMSLDRPRQRMILVYETVFQNLISKDIQELAESKTKAYPKHKRERWIKYLIKLLPNHSVSLHQIRLLILYL